MQPQSIPTALILAFGALLAAFVNNILLHRMSSRLKDIEHQHREEDALRSYRYDAKKRLYSELGPLLFALTECCEEARWRIGGIARSARDNQLGVGQQNRFRVGSDYMLSTIYRLVLPLAILRLVQQQLSRVDLSVDPSVWKLYFLAKLLRRTWNSGREVALDRGVAYDYRKRSAEGVDAVSKQHVNMQRIDQLVDKMIAPARGKQARSSVIRYSEFLDAYEDDGSDSLRLACEPLERIFTGFHPERQEVLWQVLYIQYVLCGIIAHDTSREAGGHPVDHEGVGRDFPASERSLWQDIRNDVLIWNAQPNSDRAISLFSPKEVQDCATEYILSRLPNSFRVHNASQVSTRRR